MIVNENDPRSTAAFNRRLAGLGSPDPKPNPPANPAGRWTARLVEAVRRIPAGDRGAFYDYASLVTLKAAGAAEILDTVATAERTLTRAAADALWIHAEQQAPTLNEGTRFALTRHAGGRYDRPLVHYRTAATYAPA